MSLSGMPRPMKFNSLNEFVLGNSQNFQQSYQSRSPKSGVFVIRNTESLYDRYNVNNLMLQKVNKNHLQVLNKNIVLDQQDIDPNKILSRTGFKKTGNINFNQTSKQQTKTMTQLNNFMQTNITRVNNYQNNEAQLSTKPVAKTSQGFYNSSEKPSKQYSQNQLLFNFNKIAQQKKAKKKQFLETIEAKLEQIEQQAKQLQDCQFQEAIELQQIQRIHGEIGRQIATNSFNGKIKQKVYQNIDHEEDQQHQQHSRPQSLHLNMSPVQINHVLTNHFDENQKLLDQIIRIKSKSKEKYSNQELSPGKSKQFSRTGISVKNTNLNKTSTSQNKKTFIPNQTQKTILSATTKLPPKHGKR